MGGMDSIDKERAGRQNTACEQEPSTVQLQPDTSPFIFLLQVREETCQNKLSGSRGLSKSHQSLCHLLFCFCARQQCQLPLEFLHLRDLLHLTALPTDAAWSSHSCEPLGSFTFPFDTCADPWEKWYSPPADVKTHFASSCILPKSKWGLGRMPPAFFPLHNPLSSLWCFCCCCLHKAFQSYWNPLDFKAKHTNTWLCESTATHTMKSGTLL